MFEPKMVVLTPKQFKEMTDEVEELRRTSRILVDLLDQKDADVQEMYRAIERLKELLNDRSTD